MPPTRRNTPHEDLPRFGTAALKRSECAAAAMIQSAGAIAVAMLFWSAPVMAQPTPLEVNGVTCEQVGTVLGMTACLTRATLDGRSFSYNFSPAGASIDLDHDGTEDLILSTNWSVLNTAPIPVSFFKSLGNGKDFLSYSPRISGNGTDASALFTRNVIVGDFNSDGKQDFYLADATEYTTPPSTLFDGTSQYLYLSSGSGTFTKTNTGVGVKTVHGAASGAPSRDGFALVLNTPWQPMVTSPNWVNFISVGADGAITNKSVLYSDPLFAPLSPVNGGFPYLTAIDVNGDGARDVVMLARYGNNNNVIWLNDGRGNLTLSTSIPNWVSGLYQAENAEVGDLNGDGRQDMIVMHIDRRTNPETRNSTLRVWINDGTGGFVDRTDTWLGTNFQDYTSGFFDYKITDLDDDGFPDVIFTTHSPPPEVLAAKIVVLKNNGGRAFDVLNFDILKWNEPQQVADQWMPGSVVILPVNGKPTVMFSRAGQVYNVRFTTSGTPGSQSDCLFNWAEKTYPTLFAPAAASNTLTPYYYRYYPQTLAYLATSATDNHVYYLGTISNNTVLDVGDLPTWQTAAGCP